MTTTIFDPPNARTDRGRWTDVGHGTEIRTVDPGPASLTARLVWPSLGSLPIYDELSYDSMSADDTRDALFTEALAQLSNGRRVMDIGCGRDANWALHALRNGADGALGVDLGADAVEQARALLEREGFESSSTVVRSDFFDFETDFAPDLCVTETVGSIAGAEGIVPIVKRAHEMMVEPALVVPARCQTIAALVCLDDLVDQLAFHEVAASRLQRAFDFVGHAFAPRLSVPGARLEHLRSTTAVVEDLLLADDPSLSSTAEATVSVTSEGRIDGVLLWLRLNGRVDGPTLDSLSQRTSWTPVYYPIFDEPVAVQPGDRWSIVFDRIGHERHPPDYRCGLADHKGQIRTTIESPYPGSSASTARPYSTLFRRSDRR